jgi:hypothetical protein
MSVAVMLHLFGKPGQELEEGGAVTAEDLRQLAQDLNLRLQAAAEVVDKLTGAGWEAEMGLYDIFLSHPFLGTEAEARAQLDGLGIDPDQVHIDEFEDEEEFADDEEEPQE